MLKLKKLHLVGVGRFVEPQTVDFESLGSLIQVDGDNKETGGSSGSGKSTIFNGLDYLLNLNDIPTTVLQSRLTKESMLVKGEFDWNGKSLVISRGKKEGLSVIIDGEVKAGSVKLIEEELDKIIAMPRELFRQMLHKRQFERGFFLSMTPKETYEFLTSCLNLEEEKKKADAEDKKITELEKQKISFTNMLEVQKQGKKAAEDSLITLGLGPIKEMHEEVVFSLFEKVKTSKDNYLLVEHKHKTELEELYKQRPIYRASPYVPEPFRIVPFNRSILDKCENGMKAINERLAIAIKQEMDRQAAVNRQISEQKIAMNNNQNAMSIGKLAKVDAEFKAKQIKAIKDNQCPTCDQAWANEKSKSQEKLLMDEILGLKQAIVNGIEAQKGVEEGKQRISDLVLEACPIISAEHEGLISAQDRLNRMILEEKSKESIHNKIQIDLQLAHTTRESEKSKNQNDAESLQNHLIMAEYNAKEEFLRSRHKLEIDQVAGQMEIDYRTHLMASEKLNAYKMAKSDYDVTFSRMKAQLQGYSKSVDSLEEELQKNSKSLILAIESKRAIKSYISCSFDDALNQIGDMATRIVRAIPNMANATVRLEGLKETKEGKIKEEVNAIISTDGEEDVPIKSLSGGEGTALHLAIDLSVLDLVSSRTGMGTDLLILDEPFVALDSINSEAVLNMLIESGISKRLLIVDHSEITKSLIPSKILVIREGLFSRIEQK